MYSNELLLIPDKLNISTGNVWGILSTTRSPYKHSWWKTQFKHPL